MGKIKAGALIDLFERMAREHWTYEWGAAREGCVDCSGAFVYAYEQLGGGYIEHGSNSIYHNRAWTAHDIGDAKPGWACFKVRAWRDEDKDNKWYDMAPGDVYHIGLMGRDGRILNAKSTAAGFVASEPRDGWTLCAPLMAVDYSEADEQTGGEDMAEYGNGRVIGGALNVREGASTSSRRVGQLRDGTRVNVVREVDNGWYVVCTEGGVYGYVMAEYIKLDPDAGEVQGEDDEDAQETASGEGETRKVTCIVRDDGVMIWLQGSWRVAED